MQNFIKIVVLSFSVFFFSWFAVYKTGLNTLAIQSEDTLPAMFIPVTLIKEGTLHVDTYYNMLVTRYPHSDDPQQNLGLTPFYVRKVSPDIRREFDSRRVNDATLNITYRASKYHYISAFPIMSGVLALPVYLPALLANVEITWPNVELLSHIASALIAAVATGLFYLLVSRHFLERKKQTLLLTLVYAFGTLNFSLSQALWQHTVVQLFTIVALYFFLEFTADSAKKYALVNLYVSGFFLGFACLARPTAALYLPFLLVLLVKVQKPNFLAYYIKTSIVFILGLVPAFLFFLWYNNTFYFTILNQGYSSQATTGWQSNMLEGFMGLWVSPSKGILIYSPILIFSLIGFGISLRKTNWESHFKYILFMGIVLVHTLILGKWKHWYGGWSYGYRMASDILPFLVLLLVPYLQSSLFKKTKKLFYLFFGISILVQIHGLLFFDGVWHAAYDRGFEDTRWLWSIRDSEFVFTFRRLLTRLDIIEKACEACLPGN